MKKSIILMSVIGLIIITLVIIIILLNPGADQKSNITNINVNSVLQQNEEFLTQSFSDLGITIKYPKSSSISSRDYSQSSSVIAINKPSEKFDDYFEYYQLKKNVAVEKGMTLKDYVTKLNGAEYQDKIQSIILNGKQAFQIKSMKSTDIYIGTYFEDSNSNFYYFYIEQTAPSTLEGYTGYLSEDYLEQMASTYDKILDSIEINNN